MIDLYAQFNKQLYRLKAEEVSKEMREIQEISNSELMFSLGGSIDTDPILLSSGNLAGNITVIDGTLKSSNFETGVSGWQLTPTTSEFPSITVSGGTIKYQKTSFTDTVNAGYHISSSGFYFGSANDASYIKYNIGTGDFDYVGDVSGDVINARLDSSAQKILKDFTFGSTDYSGAVKTGTITWDATTGDVTGGSGAVFHKGGLIFASAGVETITLNGITGSADFAGTITGATITGGTIRTSASGKRIVLSSSDNSLSFYDVSDNLILGLGTDADRNLVIESATDIISFRVYNNSSVALTVANLASFDVQNVSSVADSLQLTNVGSGLCLLASNTGTGSGAYISTSSSTREALKVNQTDLSKAGILIESVDVSDSIKGMLEIYRMSGGAGVSSQGASIGFYGRDSAANKEEIGSLGFGFTNQTNGSEASKALITLRSIDILELRSTGTVVVGNQAALATNATDGFLYIPTSAGTPTGTPTAFTGKVAMEYDTSNNKLYIYNGGWKSVTLA